jgi:hypothetical protein
MEAKYLLDLVPLLPHYPGEEGLVAVGFRNFLHENPNPNPNPIWVGKEGGHWPLVIYLPTYLPTRLGTSKSNPPRLPFLISSGKLRLGCEKVALLICFYLPKELV